VNRRLRCRGPRKIVVFRPELGQELQTEGPERVPDRQGDDRPNVGDDQDEEADERENKKFVFLLRGRNEYSCANFASPHR
jgi:hypothetical protein